MKVKDIPYGPCHIVIYLPEGKLPDYIQNGVTKAGYSFGRKSVLIIHKQRYTDYICHCNIFNPTTKTIQWCLVSEEATFKVMPGKLVNKAYEKYIAPRIQDYLGHAFTIGADPEIFVENKDGIFPAFDFLGSKESPNIGPSSIRQYDTEDHGLNKIYWDGFQAEFTTFSGACMAWFVDSMKCGLEGVLKAAQEKDPTAKLSTKTVIEVDPNTLHRYKPEHIALGCMPSRNVYGMKGEFLPAEQTFIRSAGGHLHFGIGKVSEEVSNRIVKILDAIVGVACVSLFAKYDNPMRRRYYGLAGEHRLPAHGLEYRVLSNAWAFHPFITHLVFGLARKVVVMGQKNYNSFWKAEEAEVIRVINECDVKGAQKILNDNKTLLKNIFQAAWYRGETDNEAIFNIFINGMDSVVEDTNNFIQNWLLFETKGTDGKKWIPHSESPQKTVGKGMPYIIQGKKVA